MGKKAFVLLFIYIILIGGFSSASAAAAPGRMIGGVFSNALSALLKLWSLPVSIKSAASTRPLMKFESGYTVETVFDGSKLGIEPFSVEVLSSGELLVLDSASSNIYKVSLPLSRYSRPRLIAGSPEGHSGHVDGKPREARLNHPKGITVDDRGNIYVADAMNMAVRKINDNCVTTIAGGRWSRGGHVDGPSEDAKFSNDFEVVYVGSTCSLLVVDRGNQAVREIHLNLDDCTYEYSSDFPLGMAVLVAAGFFGYMVALLQRRVSSIIFAEQVADKHFQEGFGMSDEQNIPASSYQKPNFLGDERESQEGFVSSLGKLLLDVGASVIEIFRGIFPGFRRKLRINEHIHYQDQQKQTKSWPMQETFSIPKEDEPPSLEARTTTPRKTYPFMSKDHAKSPGFRLVHPFYNEWDGNLLQKRELNQHQHCQYATRPYTCYEGSGETRDVIFGAVQEQVGKQDGDMKTMNYTRPIYDHHSSMRLRPKSMDFTSY